MITPVDVGVGRAILNWIKNSAGKLFKYGKRLATLEERVTALEAALKTMPPKACPFCGEREMRLTEQSMVKGDPGKQWTEDYWTCAKCGKEYRETKKL